MEDLDAAEDEGLGSAPDSPLKLQRKESTSSSSDMASPGEKYSYHVNNTTSAIHMPQMGNISHVPPSLNQNRYQGQMFQGPNNGSSMPSLAEPVYPCGICQKEVDDNDEAILCETGCGKWYHRVCTGLTVAAYHMLTNSTSAEWVCNSCIETKNIPLVKLTS
ncbi:uncharacterized protein LOC110236280 isoform X2 [Exaiptasia diaphana]|nr:uncharacterized protein LOC110236261 isoform X2 [Exaiptasia diaphana]XP_028514041.1 uncharacterized protein LOC110236280 isoform X2 [Exaiptasia diaphana]